MFFYLRARISAAVVFCLRARPAAPLAEGPHSMRLLPLWQHPNVPEGTQPVVNDAEPQVLQVFPARWCFQPGGGATQRPAAQPNRPSIFNHLIQSLEPAGVPISWDLGSFPRSMVGCALGRSLPRAQQYRIKRNYTFTPRDLASVVSVRGRTWGIKGSTN